MNFISLHHFFLGLPRLYKIFLLVILDCLFLPLALYSSYVLRLSDFYAVEFLQPALPLFISVTCAGFVFFMKLGLYRAVTRYFASKSLFSVVIGVFLTSVSLYFFVLLFDVQPFPRSVPVIFSLVAFAYVGGSRFLFKTYYQWLLLRYVSRSNLAIYGAGSVGVQLANVLEASGDYLPVLFLDDKPSLQGSHIAGLSVESPNNLDSLIDTFSLDAVLVAIPSATDTRRAEIFSFLSNFPIRVKSVPNILDDLNGVELESIRDVELEDLLERDIVPPSKVLIDKNIKDKVVLITGAGGSIGSELSRQVLASCPASIVLLDSSEFALYSIHKELCDRGIDVIPVLGSVCDDSLVRRVMSNFNINTVYHAAAYKHVPLVEQNILQGLYNNVIGTSVIVRASCEFGVETFVMVSTDKAVRPTNIMGATKRFAELVVQNAASECSTTVFCMVRFGNVLGSSGSVIPLFREQVNRGGPVTVTHPDISRFFMMIPEASSLVIQAGAMSQGGEVFVLDMGSPVKILDMAKSLIRLSGKVPFVDGESDGDIEIRFTGLRPGEKLYEELIIGGDVKPTEHEKIMSANEVSISTSFLESLIIKAKSALDSGDSFAAREVIKLAVPEYQPSKEFVDWSAHSNASDR